jgi:beta-glucosidase
MPWIENVPAILEMYLAGDNVGSATVSLLFGETNPSGKLAESFPLKLSDTPPYMFYPGERGFAEYREGIYVGYRYYDKCERDVLFPFGHGLSYTQFEYSDLKLDKNKMTDNETLSVTVKVKNTGKAAGKEAVQVYIRDPESSVGKPIRELKQFTKVNLSPGEEKTVTLTLDKLSFSYYEPRLPGWFVESGTYIIDVGSSSRSIHQSAEVEVTSTQEIPIVYTRHSTMGDISKTEKGQAIMAAFRSQSAQKKAEESTSIEHLGEGADEMVKAMMLEMPLKSAVNFGAMTEEQLQGLLAALNG